MWRGGGPVEFISSQLVLGRCGSGEYLEVSATYGRLNVVGEDATAWGKETDGEEGHALDTPDCHGGQGKVSL